MRLFLILPFLFFLSYLTVSGQENENSAKEETKGRHRLTLLMANSHVPSASEVDGDKKILLIPAWGLNYDYWFNEKWALGLHSEIFLQQFKIEEYSNSTTIERSYPVAVSLVGLFKPTKHWTFLLGGGREFEEHESFYLVCLGTEYGIELPDNWEININLIYDNKIDAYDSWMFGVGFSKILGTR